MFVENISLSEPSSPQRRASWSGCNIHRFGFFQFQFQFRGLNRRVAMAINKQSAPNIFGIYNFFVTFSFVVYLKGVLPWQLDSTWQQRTRPSSAAVSRMFSTPWCWSPQLPEHFRFFFKKCFTVSAQHVTQSRCAYRLSKAADEMLLMSFLPVALPWLKAHYVENRVLIHFSIQK